MVDPADTKTRAVPCVPPVPPAPPSAGARLTAAHYVAPRERGSCRTCKHRATNTPRPWCALHRAPVDLGGVCNRAALA